MAMDTSKLHLPKTVATAVVNKVKETSTIAALSPSSPQIFTDKEYMIFNGAAEADVTAEGQTKSSYEQDLNYVSGKTFKVQTTTRVTSELKWADEDNRFQIIQSIQADQAEAIGRALDYVVYYHMVGGIERRPHNRHETQLFTRPKETRAWRQPAHPRTIPALNGRWSRVT